VLSAFGLVPAAVMGIDVRRFLERAAAMVSASSPRVTPEACPGVRLGAALGTLAKAGRDKVTILTSPALQALGAWLEQLLAESTGKHGTGLVPVDREPVGPPAVYGDDRVFVYVRDEAAPDPAQDSAVAALAAAGAPVITIPVAEAMDLGQEFFRWEVATAVAGSVLGIHPFDQPDVEAAKVATRKLVTEYETRGELPGETPLRIGKELGPALRAHLGGLGPGDYFAALAYLPMNPGHESELTAIRCAVRDAKRVATCGGFGPRYLHSTGQVYKGGPATGVFLVLTGDPLLDQAVPKQRATFGVVAAAQARGDAAVMVERRQRVLRVHLGRDVSAELAALRRMVIEAVSA
jgi:transaldolase/glucose-6-phosphate isomerase